MSATTAVVTFALKSGGKLKVMRSPDGVLIGAENGDRVTDIELTEEGSECLLSALLETRVDKTKPLPCARPQPPARTKSAAARDIAKIILEQPDVVSKELDRIKENKIAIDGYTIHDPAGLDALGKFRPMLGYRWKLKWHESDLLRKALCYKHSEFRKLSNAVCARLKETNQSDCMLKQPGRPNIYTRAAALEMLAVRLANIQRPRRIRLIETLLCANGGLCAVLSREARRMARALFAACSAPKAGKIHLYCRACGRFQENRPRCDGDPANAAVLLTQCECTPDDSTPDDYLVIRGHKVSTRRAKP